MTARNEKRCFTTGQFKSQIIPSENIKKGEKKNLKFQKLKIEISKID